jgi:hypothetical protein
MLTAIQVHPVNATKDNGKATAAADRKLIDRLVKMWMSNAGRDLETRYQMGQLLNARLGSPTERQPHGQRVLKTVAERLGTAESDLNRDRWYSHLVDVDGLRQHHSEIDTWTKFKEALPNLKAEHGYGARKTSANPSRPAYGGFAKSLKNLTAKLIGLDSRPDDAERGEFVSALRELAEAVSSRLMINVVVAVE